MGHLSVIYTVECQINFTLQLIAPTLRTLPSYRSCSVLLSLPFFSPPPPSFVEVKPESACADSAWTQCEAKKLAWPSGYIAWAINPKTSMNSMMYPDWQFLSAGAVSSFFVYKDIKSGKEVNVCGSAFRARKPNRSI